MMIKTENNESRKKRRVSNEEIVKKGRCQDRRIKEKLKKGKERKKEGRK